MQILRGRLIALTALIAYYAATYFEPRLALIFIVAFFIALPWIVVSSLRFHARMSAYRGLRFNFTGSVGEAARIFIGLQLLLIPTLGLILPYLAYRQVRFIAEHTVYGQTAARYQGTSKPFWGVYLLAFVLMLLPIALMVLGGFQIYQARMAGMPPEMAMAVAGTYFFAGTVLFYLMIPVISAMIMARTANLL